MPMVTIHPRMLIVIRDPAIMVIMVIGGDRVIGAMGHGGGDIAVPIGDMVVAQIMNCAIVGRNG